MRTFPSIIHLVAQPSSTYEQCCVLFNIGALQTQIAKSQNFDSDDGIKNAAKHFQVPIRVDVIVLLGVLMIPYTNYNWLIFNMEALN